MIAIKQPGRRFSPGQWLERLRFEPHEALPLLTVVDRKSTRLNSSH